MPIKTAYDVYRHFDKRMRAPADVRAVAAAWRAKHVEQGRDEYADPLREDVASKSAYVNHGRWLVDCACGNGVPISDTAEAVCFSCGTVWTSIVFAVAPKEIESMLAERQFDRNRNWKPGETLAMLRDENAARGVR